MEFVYEKVHIPWNLTGSSSPVSRRRVYNFQQFGNLNRNLAAPNEIIPWFIANCNYEQSANSMQNPNNFQSRKCIWKYCSHNGTHLSQVLICQVHIYHVNNWYVLHWHSFALAMPWKLINIWVDSRNMMMSSNGNIFRVTGPFCVPGIHRPPVNSPHKGQWRGALMFSLIYVWTNGWVNNRDPVDLRRHRADYDVTLING